MTYPAAPRKVYTDSQENYDGSCAVLALQAATGCAYNDARAYAKTKLGFRPKKGTPNYTLMNMDKMSCFGHTATKIEREDRPKTLNQACKAYSEGSYFVMVKGHAVAIKDGKLIDNGYEIDPADKQLFRGRRRVIFAIKMTPNARKNYGTGVQLTLAF